MGQQSALIVVCLSNQTTREYRRISLLLLYGRDARLPYEDVFSVKQMPYQVDLDDYKTELTVGLPDAWRTAQDHLKSSQKSQKRKYDRHAKERNVRVGDRVMVLMPAEQTGKNRKLHRPYFGPYRILEVHPNGVTVVPVDRPKDHQIRVNLDRVTLCYSELPDVSYTGRNLDVLGERHDYMIPV